MSFIRRKAVHLAASAAIAFAIPLAGATAAGAATGPPTVTVAGWNGLIEQGSAYAVGTDLTVPLLRCPSHVRGSLPLVSEWVGLGGVGHSFLPGPPLIQVGIINACGANGGQFSSLIWQDVPGLDVPGAGAHIMFSYPVHPGDAVSVGVQYLGGNNFHLDAGDLSRSHGWIWSTQLSDWTDLGAVPNTAEWIVEAPATNFFSHAPLPNFGTSQFELSSYEPKLGQGGQFVINSEVIKVVTDYASGRPETKVSNLSGAGNFIVRYQKP